MEHMKNDRFAPASRGRISALAAIAGKRLDQRGAYLGSLEVGMNRSLASPIRIDVRSRRPGGFVFFVEAVLAWQDRIRQRQQLALMDDRLLRDLGLTRADVAIESAKPFWRV
jgi:uncharacterized protein YjiS (DUF1127 family)